MDLALLRSALTPPAFALLAEESADFPAPELTVASYPILISE